jgi:hypothetical protein
MTAATPDSGAPVPEGGLAAALVQLSAHAERLSGIDRALADLGSAVGEVRAGLGQHAAALASLARLERTVRDLAGQLAPKAGSGAAGYEPGPVTRWWALDGADREQAITYLRAWVATVYRPLYGHLAAQLGDCWDQHPLALQTLDWLCELFNVLYLAEQRAISGHAEFGTRILPAAARLLGEETRNCPQHRTPANPAPAWAGAQ